MSLTEEQLEGLFIGNESFSQLESSLDVFCPFDAIGMVRQEIRHGSFLRFILDPKRPHGFGADCLRALMVATAAELRERGIESIRPLDVHLMQLDAAWVPQNEYKSIDILVELTREQIVIAVELKIDATEHSGQLARYRKTVETDWPAGEGWRHIFLFLTKHGEEPSPEHGERWMALDLEDFADALEGALDKASGHPQAHDLVRAYVAMLRREHLTDKRLEDLARKLWAEHREALEYLSDRRPDTRAALLQDVYDRRDEVASALSNESGITLVADHSSPNRIRFAIDDWDLVPGMQSGTGWKPSTRLLLFEIEKSGDSIISCKFELGPGDAKARQAIFQALQQVGADVGGNWTLYDKWRQLAHKALLKVTEEHTHDFEAASRKLIGNAAAFLRAHFPKYSEAMRTLHASGMA